ncbi:hypothetical protein Dimus_007625 [Dionaea muscipula]
MIARPYAGPISTMVHAQPSSTISRDRPFGLNSATSGDQPSNLCSIFRTARVSLLELSEGGGLSWVLHARLAAHGRGARPPSCRCARPSRMYGRSALELLAVIFIMPGLHGSTPVLGICWKIGVQLIREAACLEDDPITGLHAAIAMLGLQGVMSSSPREWSWEPRVTIHPSLLEMTPLRIPSPTPNSPEYSRQSSEGSSFSGDKSCPPCGLGEGDVLGVSVGGGGSDRLFGLDDDDVRSYVGSEEAGLRTPPLQDLTGVPSLDETSMTKGRRLQIPSRTFANIGRGRRGAGGRGRPDSPDRARVSTRDLEDHDRRSSRDAEDRHPKPPSAELMRGKGVASDYPRESQKRRPPTGPIDFQDPFGGWELVIPLGGSACGSSSSVTPASYANERFKYEMIDGHRVELDSNGNILPRDLRFAGPQLKICGLPYQDDGFICCESNALALAQAMANVSLADQKVYRYEMKGRMTEWMGRDLNWNLSLNIVGQLISASQEAIVDRDDAWKKVKTLEEEIAGLRGLHTELTSKYNELQDSVWRLEGSLKKERNQSTSHLTELESARSKCGELEGKIDRLEKRIA